MIEDSPPSQRVHIYTWIEVANILAGFFAPIAGFFVLRFGLVPAVRGLYLFAFLSMTAMFLIRNAWTRETAIGLVRMEETRHHSPLDGFREYPEVLWGLAADPLVLTAFALAVLNNVHVVLRNTFLGIILNRGLELPQEMLAVFPAAGSAAALLVHVFIMPGLGRRNPKRPLFAGLLLLIAGYGLLLFAPRGSFAAAMVSTIVAGVGAAVVTPFVNGNLANRVPDDRRAKTMALVYAGVYGGTAPFGWLAGMLSALNPRLPAALLLLVFAAAVGCLFRMRRAEKKAVR
jgi:Na+/melibiose symporter-like transporter